MSTPHRFRSLSDAKTYRASVEAGNPRTELSIPLTLPDGHGGQRRNPEYEDAPYEWSVASTAPDVWYHWLEATALSFGTDQLEAKRA